MVNELELLLIYSKKVGTSGTGLLKQLDQDLRIPQNKVFFRSNRKRRIPANPGDRDINIIIIEEMKLFQRHDITTRS